MAVDQTYVNYIAPEFSGESNTRVVFVIGLATLFINQSFWPADQVDFAIALLTAHILKTGNMKGAIGLGGRKAGDLAENYRGMDIKRSLQATGYGLLLLELINTLPISPQVYPGVVPFVPNIPVDITNLNWPD